MGVSTILSLLSLPALAANSYLGALGVLARPGQKSGTGTYELSTFPHFTFVVPAHNESAGIERTVRSLTLVDYPTDRFSILVIADNCSDDTAARARLAGARVLERNDTTLRGKGYALEFAFKTLLEESQTDGVVVVDADSDVGTNFLRISASRLTSGERAMQAHYAVRNVDDSWRTRLMDVAFTIYHGVRSTARESMGLSVGLRGNGMVFALSTLRQVPYRAYSLVEDVEFGIELALVGIRVAYIGDAKVCGEMVTDAVGSESQRQRWEQGRRQLLRQYLPLLLGRGIRKQDFILLDLACDMLVPPLATVAVYTSVGVVGAVGAVATGLSGPIVILPWLVSVAGLTTYVARGIMMSERGPSVVLDLVHVPKYVFWKLTLPLRAKRAPRGEWIRTARNDESR